LIVQTVDLDAGKRGQAAGSPPAGDDWRLIWTQLHSFRQHLLFLLEQVNEADLSRRPAARPDISLYGLFAAAVEDDWRAAHAVGTLTGESVSCDL
jgi:hypothetical protein